MPARRHDRPGCVYRAAVFPSALQVLAGEDGDGGLSQLDGEGGDTWFGPGRWYPPHPPPLGPSNYATSLLLFCSPPRQVTAQHMLICLVSLHD